MVKRPIQAILRILLANELVEHQLPHGFVARVRRVSYPVQSLLVQSIRVCKLSRVEAHLGVIVDWFHDNFSCSSLLATDGGPRIQQSFPPHDGEEAFSSAHEPL